MKRLLLRATLLLVTVSSVLADTPAKIAEDYRKASAAALVKVNETLEKATVPLIAALVKAGDTAGAEELQQQLKAKLAGEPVLKPQASAANIFKLYDAARVKALDSAQKAAVARIEAMLNGKEGGSLEVVAELGKVRAEINAGGGVAAAAPASPFPMHWSYHLKPERQVDNGFMDMKPDGTLVLGNVNDSTPGRWSATSRANVLSVILEGEKGGETCEMRIYGNEAELVRPVGTRYLKARAEPGAARAENDAGKGAAATLSPMPPQWTYHATERPDGSVGPAHGELHFHPDGTVSINDLANPKIPHTGLWKANSKGDRLTLTVEGFGQWKMELKGSTGTLDRPEAASPDHVWGMRYLRVKAPKA
ncbi:hypothetical protein [Prosthecobacter fluviatilis]|uniref:Uncharacterized protein n=1 Tax=Prosthecobacter fluviatilis TaxID=445931 RepID=A0ABW0KWA2_9BACT